MPANLIRRDLLCERVCKIQCSTENLFFESPKHSPIETQAKINLEANLLVFLCLHQTQIKDLHDVSDSLWTENST